MNKGSVAKREPSVTNRKRCAIVIRPKITPVVMIYAFIDPPRAVVEKVRLYLPTCTRPVAYLTRKKEIQLGKYKTRSGVASKVKMQLFRSGDFH